MAITSVWLDETDNVCISCGACEAVCPEVFEIPDKMEVKNDADFNAYEDQIIEAANDCPTQVIRYDQQ
ncbi:MAG TPA: ferredoxin [Bacteroidales bacterium]|nr:ferredoxin [Bacteroidales bacterium]